jgi:RNA polymerase subunit RPABC4/transcription elongation factor Spt4
VACDEECHNARQNAEYNWAGDNVITRPKKCVVADQMGLIVAEVSEFALRVLIYGFFATAFCEIACVFKFEGVSRSGTI